MRTLALREQTNEYATCDLDAELTFDVLPAAGRADSFTRTIGGPVVLGRTSEGWRIADYTRAGTRAIESCRVYGPDARIELDGFAVTPLGLSLRATGMLFVFEVTNRGAGELVVRGVTAPTGGLSRSHWTYLDGRRIVRPGRDGADRGPGPAGAAGDDARGAAFDAGQAGAGRDPPRATHAAVREPSMRRRARRPGSSSA